MPPICSSRHTDVHPGTAAVNQTACSLAIKGRAFATDNHSTPKSHQMNIKNNIKMKIGILTIATGIFWLVVSTISNRSLWGCYEISSEVQKKIRCTSLQLWSYLWVIAGVWFVTSAFWLVIAFWFEWWKVSCQSSSVSFLFVFLPRKFKKYKLVAYIPVVDFSWRQLWVSKSRWIQVRRLRAIDS